MSAAALARAPEAPRYSLICSLLVIETISASTSGLDSTQRNAACEKVAPSFSYGRMSLRRAPRSVFITTTPTPFALAFSMTRQITVWIATKSNERR